MSKLGLTRVTLFLDPSVARRFAIIAAEQGTDRSSLVTQWVKYVDAHRPPPTESVTTT